MNFTYSQNHLLALSRWTIAPTNPPTPNCLSAHPTSRLCLACNTPGHYETECSTLSDPTRSKYTPIQVAEALCTAARLKYTVTDTPPKEVTPVTTPATTPATPALGIEPISLDPISLDPAPPAPPAPPPPPPSLAYTTLLLSSTRQSPTPLTDPCADVPVHPTATQTPLFTTPAVICSTCAIHTPSSLLLPSPIKLLWGLASYGFTCPTCCHAHSISPGLTHGLLSPPPTPTKWLDVARLALINLTVTTPHVYFTRRQVIDWVTEHWGVLCEGRGAVPKFWDQDLCTHLRKNPKLFKVRDSVGGGSRFEYMLTQEGVGKTVGGEVAIPGALWEKIGGGGGEEEERKRGFEEAGAMRANVVTPMEEVGEVEAPVDRIREVRLQGPQLVGTVVYSPSPVAYSPPLLVEGYQAFSNLYMVRSLPSFDLSTTVYDILELSDVECTPSSWVTLPPTTTVVHAFVSSVLFEGESVVFDGENQQIGGVRGGTSSGAGAAGAVDRLYDKTGDTYLVKWSDSGFGSCSWEPERHFLNERYLAEYDQLSEVEKGALREFYEERVEEERKEREKEGEKERKRKSKGKSKARLSTGNGVRGKRKCAGGEGRWSKRRLGSKENSQDSQDSQCYFELESVTTTASNYDVIDLLNNLAEIAGDSDSPEGRGDEDIDEFIHDSEKKERSKERRRDTVQKKIDTRVARTTHLKHSRGVVRSGSNESSTTHSNESSDTSNPTRVKPTDSAVFFKLEGGNVICLCGWCGKRCDKKKNLGGHVKAHAAEDSYPRMPNPPPEVLQELEEIGAVEVVKDEEGGSWEEVGE